MQIMTMYPGMDLAKLRPMQTVRKVQNLASTNNIVKDNMARYMVPQECGAKEEVRWAKITDRKGRGMLFEMDKENQ